MTIDKKSHRSASMASLIGHRLSSIVIDYRFHRLDTPGATGGPCVYNVALFPIYNLNLYKTLVEDIVY